jgi:putative hydrolases of HD superfamily
MNLKTVQPALRFSVGTEAIWSTLSALPRTGWIQWGIPNPESVADHILAIRSLALQWRENIDLSDLEFSDLLAIIEVHDWPEAIVGDLVIMGDERDVIKLRSEKRNREKIAMVELCQGKPFGTEALALYERYEMNVDAPARYAKQLDKLQAVLLAAEYEKQYNKPGLLQEFIAYSEHYIDIPFLHQELLKL